MAMGKFITLEGIEGAGKSTALKLIRDFLIATQKDIVLTHEPGGTPLADEIRQLLLTPNRTEKVSSMTELLLMFAARAQHVAQCILPALKAGQWVISDRYIDATYAYQGGGRGLDFKDITQLDRLVVNELYPDLTLLLDLPVELGMQRAQSRGNQKDRIEQERVDFFVRVREQYLERAAQDPTRIKLIDASLSLREVQLQIETILREFLSL